MGAYKVVKRTTISLTEDEATRLERVVSNREYDDVSSAVRFAIRHTFPNKKEDNGTSVNKSEQEKEATGDCPAALSEKERTTEGGVNI